MCGRIQRFTCGNYSITLIPVGDYDSEFGSFFQWKTKRDEEISATVNRIQEFSPCYLEDFTDLALVLQKVDTAIH